MCHILGVASISNLGRGMLIVRARFHINDHVVLRVSSVLLHVGARVRHALGDVVSSVLLHARARVRDMLHVVSSIMLCVVG